MLKQLTFDMDLGTAYTRDDFLVLPENEHIVRMLEDLSLWKSHCMLLYGERASGKTHLSNIFVNAHEGSSIIMEACDVQEESVPGLVKDYKYIVLENAGENLSEEPVFHLFNFAKDEGVHLLMTAEKPFTEWGIKLPDLYTRLATAMAISIPEPSDEMMTALLSKMFSDRQIYVAGDVFSYIISHTERSFSALHDIVSAADKLSLKEKRKITVPLIKKVMAENVRGDDGEFF